MDLSIRASSLGQRYRRSKAPPLWHLIAANLARPFTDIHETLENDVVIKRAFEILCPLSVICLAVIEPLRTPFRDLDKFSLFSVFNTGCSQLSIECFAPDCPQLKTRYGPAVPRAESRFHTLW
ncbi:MAG: hypothetical protein ACJAVM_000253 [Sulfitobacter sp.]